MDRKELENEKNRKKKKEEDGLWFGLDSVLPLFLTSFILNLFLSKKMRVIYETLNPLSDRFENWAKIENVIGFQ